MIENAEFSVYNIRIGVNLPVTERIERYCIMKESARGKAAVGKERYSDARGYFDDDLCEFVITDMFPKRPLVNYLWSEDAVADADQFGFGKSLAGIGSFRRGLDCGERLVYIKDRKSGESYSPNRNYGRLPFEQFRCHVGLGYQKIVSVYNGLKVTFTLLVPDAGYAVLYLAEAEELAGKERDLDLYFALRPQANLTVHTSYGSADRDKEFGGLCYPHFSYQAETDYGCLYFASEHGFTSYCVSKGDFCGTYGSWEHPDGVAAQALPSRGTTFEDDYVAAVSLPLRLGPREKKSFAFALAAGRSAAESGALASSLAKTSVFYSQLALQKEKNASYQRVFRAEIPDPLLRSLGNTWLKRQLSLGKTWGRIYGKGFRDVMQDIAAFVSLDIPLARTRILYALAKQYGNGNTIRMFEPDLLLPYNDGAAWIPATISAFLKESGDFGILEEIVPYLDGGEDSVLGHMVRGVEYLLGDLGSHGLVLLRGGDWNDSLNGAGNLNKGESVWLSLATVKAAKECAEILEKLGKKEEKERILGSAGRLSENILIKGMSGGHFIYAYDDWGGVIGGEESEEGKFYLNPQTWAVLADVGDRDTQNAVMDLVEEKLKCAFGYELCAPPYTKGSDRLGRVSYFVPGMVENASVYVHGVAFKIAADCRLGRGDLAFDTLRSVLCTNPKVQASGVEPYAVTNMFIGPDNPYRAGDAPMSWVTGSAGWLYRDLTEEIFGIKAEFDGLRISPVFPSCWNEAYAERIFRGVLYQISYRRTGRRRIAVEGSEIQGDILPPQTGKDSVAVTVEY